MLTRIRRNLKKKDKKAAGVASDLVSGAMKDKN